MNASKKATVHGDASPTKLMTQSLRKQQTKKMGAKMIRSPTKKVDGGDSKENKESGLASPTSVTMQTSFIIKNADKSFDDYY